MMGLSRASFVASVAFAALSGCMADGDAMEVTRNGFKFNVSVDGTTAVARNFHTGQLNFAVLEESARAAIPFLAIGKPSTMVAAAELAPGMPNSTPLNESPVVEDATTATQNITPR